jgi:hypothetical protein
MYEKIEEFRVTKKLKELLNDCKPNKVMLVIKKIKKLSLYVNCVTAVKFNDKHYYHLIFKETENTSWTYTKDFYDELMKNKIKNNFLFLE